MNDYLVQTKYAASSLIDLIRTEEIALQDLFSTLNSLKGHHQFLYADFRRKDFDPDDHFNEHQVMHAFALQAKVRDQIDRVETKINNLKISISSKEESIKALSGALLQIAKQGISIVHGNLDNCSSGRIISNEPVKNIIWQGRNQSLHYEEGIYRAPIVNCFNNLGIQLHAINLAKEVIDLLNWTTYDNYQNDLITLLGYF
ncbi:hypothetical protein ACQKNX_02200 [Lysinibacillus sp. NPDC093712]|uniref:hypothetical protein n=1 Tax=Lysinibacillus sp. NPDC093712 TaxID=3390579 RepID=UPI003D03BC91